MALFDYDSSEPLDVRVEEPETVVFNGVATRHEISYASPRGGRVPATLFVPGAQGSLPAVLLLHGLPGSRYDTLALAGDFARAGAVTLSIDAPFARRSRLTPLSFTRRDRREQVQLIVDLRRAIDLLDRYSVDPARIGFYGGSYGGAMGGLLSGVEDRVAAYVLAAGDGGLVEHFTGPDDEASPVNDLSAGDRRRWISFMEPIEPLYYVAFAAPSELMFLNGADDELVPSVDALRFQMAASEPKEIRWYNAGHALNSLARCDAARWLQERLRFSSDSFARC